MKLQLDLSTSEVNTILDALAKEHNNTMKRKWRASSKAIHMAEVSRVRNKLVSAELLAKREASRDVDADF